MPAPAISGAARAEALLLEHLSPEQAREFRATGTVTVVKRGPLLTVVRRHLRVTLALVLAAAALAGFVGSTAAPLVRVLLMAAVVPCFTPKFLIACSRERRWRIDPVAGPELFVRRRRVLFCVRVDGTLPDADRVLAYKNVLEANEPYFLRKANCCL